MKNRLELHEILVGLLGSNNVYFQPPESVKMVYPCIVYSLNRIDTKKADNKNYLKTNNYTITFISKDPDWEVPYSLLDLPMCSFDRSYRLDNLNHWVFNLYYKGGN